MEYPPDPIDSADEYLQNVLAKWNALPRERGSRELSLAITNLEQSLMWYRKHHFKNNLNQSQPGELQRGQQIR